MIQKPVYLATMFIAGLVFVLPTVTIADICPPEGDKPEHAEINKLKNRITVPDSLKPYTVHKFLAHFPEPESEDLEHLSADERQVISDLEKEGIALTGYLLAYKRSGPESANCHDPNRLDYHIWIGPVQPSDGVAAKAMRSGAIVVEITPHGQDDHPGWVGQLRKLVKDHPKVRISGWAFFDPEHPNQIGATRATLWEVHPVMKLEVWRQGKWQNVE